MHYIRRFWGRVRIALVAMTLAAASGPPLTAACGDKSGTGPNCCKVCTTGKACGDTCIAASDTCHVGAGCACNR
jgi:hypothetical protein